MAKAKFLGVYASTRVPSVRRQPDGPPKKRYWFAWEDGWGRYRVQLLDAAFQALDTPRLVSPQEFKRYFEIQPHILVTPVVPLEVSPPEAEKQPEAVSRPQKTIPNVSSSPQVQVAQDTALALKEDLDEAEIEQAAELDHQLRSEFAMAMTRWKRGDKIAPLKVFENICKRKEGIIPAHKHMFTDFAIDLRKSSLLALAARHYQRAVELAPEDSNAHFNLARIFYETGKLEQAEEHLQRALELSPGLEIATRFLAFIQEQRKRRAPRASKTKSRFRLFSR